MSFRLSVGEAVTLSFYRQRGGLVMAWGGSFAKSERDMREIMMQSKWNRIFGAAALSAAATAWATDGGSIMTGGAGGDVPPDAKAGEGVFESEVIVTTNAPIKSVMLTLTDLTHSWAGDLSIELANLNTGVSVTLLDRLGLPEGPSSFGDSSDFSGTYIFHDEAGGNLETTAAGLGGFDAIPGGEYFPPDGTLGDFAGSSSAGTWKLTITDSSSADSGGLGGWTLTLSVPGPGPSVALLGACSIMGLRRRR